MWDLLRWPRGDAATRLPLRGEVAGRRVEAATEIGEHARCRGAVIGEAARLLLMLVVCVHFATCAVFPCERLPA